MNPIRTAAYKMWQETYVEHIGESFEDYLEIMKCNGHFWGA